MNHRKAVRVGRTDDSQPAQVCDSDTNKKPLEPLLVSSLLVEVASSFNISGRYRYFWIRVEIVIHLLELIHQLCNSMHFYFQRKTAILYTAGDKSIEINGHVFELDTRKNFLTVRAV